MPVDVALGPADLARQDVTGRPVFLIDILRATTTMCAALHHGAAAVIPAATPEAARRVAGELPAAVLAGERDCVRIPGFDLGNSPSEMRPRAVAGHVLLLCTTNGTAAFAAVEGAGEVYALAAVNFSVSVARAQSLLERSDDLLVACAGRQGGFGLDDAYTAGRFLRAVLAGKARRHGLTDAAMAAVDLAQHHGNRWHHLLRRSGAGRRLVGLGFGEDVRLAGRQDEFPVLARLVDSRIVVNPGHGGTTDAVDE